MSSKKAFNAFNHGKGKIPVPLISLKMLPTELHIKEDGSVKDEPTFVMVMTRDKYITVYGEISIEMFNDGLSDIGYKMIKK